MGRLIVLGLLAGLGAVLWRRRRADGGAAARVVVGFTDGSSTAVEPGSPERELMLATASEALA